MRSTRIGNLVIDSIDVDSRNLAKLKKVVEDLYRKLFIAAQSNENLLANTYLQILNVLGQFYSDIRNDNHQLHLIDRININTRKNTTPEGVAFERCLNDIKTRKHHSLFAPSLRAIEEGNFKLKHVEPANEAPTVSSRRQ